MPRNACGTRYSQQRMQIRISSLKLGSFILFSSFLSDVRAEKQISDPDCDFLYPTKFCWFHDIFHNCMNNRCSHAVLRSVCFPGLKTENLIAGKRILQFYRAGTGIFFYVKEISFLSFSGILPFASMALSSRLCKNPIRSTGIIHSMQIFDT